MMDKRSIRSFALGMLLATAIIGSMYYYYRPLEWTEQQLESMLKEKGLVAVNVKEYENLKQFSKQQEEKENKNQDRQRTIRQQNSTVEHETIHAYRLVVSEGKFPRDIARELEEARVIEDAADFTNYLEKRNLTRKIRVGTYNVNSKMSYEQLSQIITGQK